MKNAEQESTDPLRLCEAVLKCIETLISMLISTNRKEQLRLKGMSSALQTVVHEKFGRIEHF